MASGHRPDVDGAVTLCRWMGMPVETFVQPRVPGEMPELLTELAVLLRRYGLDEAGQRFVLAAVAALDYRPTAA
ncbi:MAG: hypothetical protein ACRDTG_06035 [Pseudonocardiaceae bacterium]